MPKNQKKIFLGFSVKQAFVDCFTPLIGDVKTELAQYPMRFVSVENYHLTLLYMGWVTMPSVQSLINRMDLFDCPASSVAPIRYAWMGKFSPRALTLEFSNAGIKNLVHECNEHFRKQDIYLGVDTIRPHLTFARHKGKVGKSKVIALEKAVQALPVPDMSLSIEQLVLYESIMQEGQVTYEKLYVRDLS